MKGKDVRFLQAAGYFANFETLQKRYKRNFNRDESAVNDGLCGDGYAVFNLVRPNVLNALFVVVVSQISPHRTRKAITYHGLR